MVRPLTVEPTTLVACATTIGGGVTSGVLLVTTNTGSLENVTVIVPATVAVPTLVRVPVELNWYSVSPTTMLGSVIVSVIGAVAAGAAPADSHDTATDVT